MALDLGSILAGTRSTVVVEEKIEEEEMWKKLK
jgi:hypothetical protein